MLFPGRGRLAHAQKGGKKKNETPAALEEEKGNPAMVACGSPNQKKKKISSALRPPGPREGKGRKRLRSSLPLPWLWGREGESDGLPVPTEDT